MKHFDHRADAKTLALAIVDTIPEPFLVLDEGLAVTAASRSFYEFFKVDPVHTHGSLLYALGNGQWDIPALRLLLEDIIPRHTMMDGFEVEHDFPGVGRRIMLLNARRVTYEDGSASNILLAFKDVTEIRRIDRIREDHLHNTEELLRQQHILYQEMQHRVANSLQIIASILLLKARSVASDETRHHLKDAHQRVMSVAAVQNHLHPSDGIDRIDVRSYLSKLCGGLAASMIGDGKPIAIEVLADQGTIASAEAVSLGLIVTELVINALKYAFPQRSAGARILVTYEAMGSDWKLVVSDNGVGKGEGGTLGGGLGTAIVTALAKQLSAKVEIIPSAIGVTVEITRATFVAEMPEAA